MHDIDVSVDAVVGAVLGLLLFIICFYVKSVCFFQHGRPHLCELKGDSRGSVNLRCQHLSAKLDTSPTQAFT